MAHEFGRRALKFMAACLEMKLFVWNSFSAILFRGNGYLGASSALGRRSHSQFLRMCWHSFMGCFLVRDSHESKQLHSCKLWAYVESYSYHFGFLNSNVWICALLHLVQLFNFGTLLSLLLTCMTA